jgi:signal transduction histidine kinase
MTESRILHHSIDAKHAQNIGEQSVSDRVQAVIEIVKNSYDGDATNCTVKFFASPGGSGTLAHVDHIEISDDGVGMTLDDIENKWMRLATSSKVEKPASPKFTRRVSGRKGMGHFATQKLGSKITIISCPEMYDERPGPDESNKTFVLLTDWDEYVPGKSFDEIGNKLVTEPRDSERSKDLHPYKQGLTIMIRKLKEDWSVKDVERLRTHLSSLQTPKWLVEDTKDQFVTRVEAYGFKITAEEKEKDISDYAPWSIEAHLRGDKINYHIRELDFKTMKKLTAKDVAETIRPSGAEPAGRKFGNSCGDADMYIYHYPGRATEYRGEEALLEGKGGWIPPQLVKEREMLNVLQRCNSGISIFKDNIRIRPYGDPRTPEELNESQSVGPLHDWLGLEERKVKRMGDHIRNTRVIGHVLLSNKNNPEVVETTTRQALVENTAFKSLKTDFAIQTIGILEEYLKERKEYTKQKMKKTNPTEQVTSEIKQLTDFLDKLPLDEDDKEQAEEHVHAISKLNVAAAQQFGAKEEELYSTIEMYRNLSSLGISALAFHHEITQPLARIEERQARLLEKWDEWNTDKKQDYVTKSLDDVDSIISLNSYIKQFASLFTGTKGARRKREKINPRRAIEELRDGFGKLLEKYNINLSVSQAGGGFDDIWVLRASFESIILNLIGNSINALTRVSRKEKWIKIEIEKRYNRLEIIVYDNGFGIRNENWGKIFRPQWTEKDGGTGMGLTIVNEIITEDYDGTIKVVKSVSEENDKGAGETTFLISIPMANLSKESK